MSSSAGRRDKRYIAARNHFRTTGAICHMCGQRPGTTVDHDPPLSTFPTPEQWQGRYLPACQPCQSKQGAAITNSRHNWRW